LKESPKYLKEVFLHGIRSKELAKQGGQNLFFARRLYPASESGDAALISFMLLRNENRPRVGSFPAPGTDHICHL